ncbi:GTPase Era [Chitinophagales bacterium]|nr:GTPase Era [Chitinophagales bacterium]
MTKIDHSKHKAGFVNIIGKPNVGKSTLMNALVGEKLAIITSKAQTTRHRIIGIVNGEDFQIVYSDTPGIMEPHYKLQESMMKVVASSFSDADLFLVIVEIGDRSIELFSERLHKSPAPKIFILNKMDLHSEEKVAEEVAFWKNEFKADQYFTVSALEKQGTAELFDSIIEMLPYHAPFYDKETFTDRPTRFFISEIIREKILINYKQEIPYSVDILIESFKEEEKIIRISSIIICNRRSQKPILIGKGGSMLKKVGTQARIDMEEFLGKKSVLGNFSTSARKLAGK